MHRRATSEASRTAGVNELSDLSDPEFVELEGLHPHILGDSMQAEPEVNDQKKTYVAGILERIRSRAAVALIFWYAFSIGLSVYNKNMFSPSGMGFSFPLLTTTLHQLVQIVLASLALVILRLPLSQSSNKERLKSIPAGLASSADIGLGNASLLVVTLSFYTMIKSSALGFVLLFSVLFGLERPNWRLAAIVAIMSFGVFLMVAGETEFNLIGFFLVLGASCFSGLRWALIKLLLSRKDTQIVRPAMSSSGHEPMNTEAVESNGSEGLKALRKPHPVQTILALSPTMLVALAVIGSSLEGPKAFFNGKIWQDYSIVWALCMVLFPGVLAFCMTWAEFELLNATGPLTLAVAGICKEVATILVSVFVFHDRLALVNGMGLSVTMISIGLYHYHRS
nr:MFS.10 [Starmerella bombicola]